MKNIYTGHLLKDNIRIEKLITVYYNEFSNDIFLTENGMIFGNWYT